MRCYQAATIAESVYVGVEVSFDATFSKVVVDLRLGTDFEQGFGEARFVNAGFGEVRFAVSIGFVVDFDLRSNVGSVLETFVAYTDLYLETLLSKPDVAHPLYFPGPGLTPP